MIYCNITAAGAVDREFYIKYRRFILNICVLREIYAFVYLIVKAKHDLGMICSVKNDFGMIFSQNITSYLKYMYFCYFAGTFLEFGSSLAALKENPFSENALSRIWVLPCGAKEETIFRIQTSSDP